MPTPAAVLLDVGGVLFLPDHARLLGAMARADFTPPADALDRAHYAGANALSGAVDSVWPEYWSAYIDAFLTALRRMPQLLVFATVQPVIFVLLFRYVFGGAIKVPGVDYVNYLMPGVFAQTVVFGAIQTGIGLAEDLNKA